MTDTKPADQVVARLAAAGELVDRAVRAVVAPGDLVERRMRAESLASWTEPGPRAGLRAALAVAKMAERRAHDYAVKLRGEGGTWKQIADLMDVPYDDRYSRLERTFEIVAGPAQGSGMYDQPSVHWRCGGPLGCDGYIRDSGPYEWYPEENEKGHTEGCRRLAAETKAREEESAEQQRRAEVSDAAWKKLTDPFDKATVERARRALRLGGRIDRKLSTGEGLAVALVLNDDEHMRALGYETRQAAILRVYNGSPRWRWRLATMRAAATGERT